MDLTMQTDNIGNTYRVTNHTAKNSTSAGMLMEIALLQHHTGSKVQLDHTYREHNTWADQLTHADSTGFSTANRIVPAEGDWQILDRLTPRN